MDHHTCAATGRQASQEAGAMQSTTSNSAVAGVGARQRSVTLKAEGRRQAKPPKTHSAAGSESEKDAHKGVVGQIVKDAITASVAPTVDRHGAHQLVHVQIARAEANQDSIPRRPPPRLAGHRPQGAGGKIEVGLDVGVAGELREGHGGS